jgi:hypothetical protein
MKNSLHIAREIMSTIERNNLLIRELKKLGYSPQYVRSQFPDIEDDEVIVTDRMHVQITEDGFYSLTFEKEEGMFTCYVETKNPRDIINQIKSLS